MRRQEEIAAGAPAPAATRAKPAKAANAPERHWTIRELVAEFGVTSRTLRFYEDEGLIGPRREGQARIYSARDRARIGLILRGRRLGFSLAEIGEMLDLYDADRSRVRQLTFSLAKGRERIAALERQEADIEVVLSELRALETIVVDLLRQKGVSAEGH